MKRIIAELSAAKIPANNLMALLVLNDCVFETHSLTREGSFNALKHQQGETLSMANLLDENEKPRKTPLSVAIVARMTTHEFERLLAVLELDFPEAKLIYKEVSAGRLWIKKEP